MFKILTVLAIVLQLTAFSAEKNMSEKFAMFQSVSQNQAILVQDGSEKKSCSRCGMNLIHFYKTSHNATYKGKKYQYCSFHCLVDHLAAGITLKNINVVDVNSLKFINVSKAYYVVGSNKRGTMTRISKYAFSTKEDAEKFQAANGGEIMDFYKALNVVKKDFN
jgi:nitrous oxide reductase accessory protein NosL